MKTIFTFIISLIALSNFSQNSIANFTYRIDTINQTISFYDISDGGNNGNNPAVEWDWRGVGGELFSTEQNAVYHYPTLDFTAGLFVTFENGSSVYKADSIFLGGSNPCAGYEIKPVSDTIYPGTCDGIGRVDIINGTAPFQFNWGAYGITDTITNLCNGNYPVIITDANGCTDSNSVYVVDEDTSAFLQIIDTLNSTTVDTCIDSAIVDVISEVISINSNVVEIKWTLIDNNQIPYVVYGTYTFSGVYGDYYVEISINCNENKLIQTWGEVITIDGTITSSATSKTITNINIFPNPVKEKTTIKFYSENSSKISIRIVDCSGNIKQLGYVQKIYNGENLIPLNISKLNNGIYFVQIISEKNIQTIKFIK